MLISIIIPVYNTDRYLQQCLNSIVSQAYTDFEIILVNDGSTDNSGLIADEYAQKYGFISVIHQENQGVSAARNRGLIKTSGQYLMFVDADDILLPDFFSKIQPLLNKKFDIIEFDAQILDKNASIIRNSLFNRDFLIGQSESLNHKKNRLSKEAKYYLWVRLIRKELIFNTSFNEQISFCEDALYLTECYYRAESIFTIDQALYGYRQHQKNITNYKNKKNIEQLFFLINHIKEYIKNTIEPTKKLFYLMLLINMVHLRKSMYTIYNKKIIPDKKTYYFIKETTTLCNTNIIQFKGKIALEKIWSLKWPIFTNILILFRYHLSMLFL